MGDARRFTRLRRGSAPEGPGLYVVPEDGLCLSTFLVVRPPARDREVLLGRVNPRAPWFDLAALEPARLAAIEDQWMLPSSQLRFFEGPQEAAGRIAREQLGTDLPPVEAFSVHSEAYRRADRAVGDPHWDLHFVYQVRWSSPEPPAFPPWRELAFRPVDALRPEEVARGQADVLGLVGLGPSRGAAASGPAPPTGPGRTRRR